MPLASGAKIGSYEVLAPLGAGGMGEVYRARDTKLDREVALKVLPESLASDPDRSLRFRREAKTVAALNHPNIITIFSVEEAEGIQFLTMELVAGKSLDMLLPRTGFSLEHFFALAIPLADAVASAHVRGVVHRDLKPGNVMVTDDENRVKVLDFGLAKEMYEPDPGAPTITGQTEQGAVMGTPDYMSPEQARGEAVDHRSDIFSLGVMFFEMATGTRPFRGANSIELLSAVLKDPPLALSGLKPELPRHLGRIIERCLEKASIDRYQAARDVFNELRSLQKEIASAQRSASSSESGQRRVQTEAPWIAVMPIECHAPDSDLENLADGLTEDITSGLSRFSYLFVISRNSTRKIESKSIDTRQAGQELGARYLIEGAVRKRGSKVRVNLQAVDARTGTLLWSEMFDRNLGETDIFAVQDEITDRVVSTVADPYGILIRSMAAPTASKPPDTLSPYETVLRFFLYQQGAVAPTHLVVRKALERAVELEPGYADAWAGLAICALDEYRHAYNPRPNSLERALSAAQRSVEIDTANPLANFALAQVHHFRGDLGAFRSAAERTISLNPRDSSTMAFLGILTGYGGDWERAIELTTNAMALNPHHPGWYHFTSFFDAYRKRRYTAALEAVQKLNLPEYYPTHYAAAITYAQLGNMPAAQEAKARALQLWPDFERDFVAGHIEKWIHNQPDLIAHILEGLDLAGFHVRRAPKPGTGGFGPEGEQL